MFENYFIANTGYNEAGLSDGSCEELVLYNPSQYGKQLKAE